MFQPRRIAHVRNYCDVFLQAGVCLALHLHVLLLLASAVRSEVDIYRTLLLARGADILQSQLLLALVEENHLDQLTTQRNVVKFAAPDGHLSNTGLRDENRAKINHLRLDFQEVSPTSQLLGGLSGDHVDLVLQVFLLFSICCRTGRCAVF